MDFDDYDECLSEPEDTSVEEVQESKLSILPVSSFEAMKDYERAGEEAFEDEGEINIVSHSHLLSDEVHYYITEVLNVFKCI